MQSMPAAHETYLELTLGLAAQSLEEGNFPVGSVIVGPDGSVLGSGANSSQTKGCAAHAEMQALAQAAPGLRTLENGTATLYTSGEPCLMCLGAVLQCTAVGTLVWAAGPVSPAGSAIAAVRASGYNAQRLDPIVVVAEPSASARRRSRELLHRWAAPRGDPRAERFKDPDGR